MSATMLLIALFFLAAASYVQGAQVHSQQHTSRHAGGKHHLRHGVAAASSAANSTASEAALADDDGDDDDDDDDDDAAVDGETKTPLRWEINANKVNGTTAMWAKGDGQGTEAEKAKLQNAVYESHENLAENLREQVAVNAEVKDLDDVEKGHRLIDASVQAVANETQSPAMASFLGDMWKEMRMFAKPFYKEHLEEKLAHLEEENHPLQANFSGSQKALTSWKPNAVTTLTYGEDSLAYGPGAPGMPNGA